MDKKIAKIQKETAKVGKDLKSLKKADKVQDKIVEKAKKMKKKGC
jgi:hypothetical protein